MKLDFRNRYRAVTHPTEKYMIVEFRRWFSPFWSYVSIGADLAAAKRNAWLHANPKPRQVYHFGPLKGEPRP